MLLSESQGTSQPPDALGWMELVGVVTSVSLDQGDLNRVIKLHAFDGCKEIGRRQKNKTIKLVLVNFKVETSSETGFKKLKPVCM